MSKRNLVLSALVACSLVLLTGAWDHQPRAVTPAEAAAFVPQFAAADAGLDALVPAQLLARAALALDPARTPWLRVKTWQKQADGEVSFEAEGRLVRGPNQCARLEMTIKSGQAASAVVVVSDGVGLAQCRRVPGRRAAVTSQRFATSDQKSLAAEEIEQILVLHGCGGPHSLVKDLQRTLVNLKMVHGTWKNKPVIRLTGSFKEEPGAAEPRFAVPPRLCQVYLDARSLWVHRVEWWAFQEHEEEAFLLLQLEFHDLQTNEPLSDEDCVREFTYDPEGES